MFKFARQFCTKEVKFVPAHSPVNEIDLVTIQRFLDEASKLVVLTGAGISTESGLPDYRSEGVGLYSTSIYRPVQYQTFLSSALIRRRYWARNYFAWPRFSRVQPNSAHQCLNEWEKSGRLHALITQNVDLLHTKAGNKRVVDLHGTAFNVICLTCGNSIPRDEFQDVLSAVNDGLTLTSTSTEIRPDSDTTISTDDADKFVIPPCQKCGGIFKPDIVFFGDNVPKNRVELVYSKVREADKFLVIGSSLAVYSAYRFLLACKEQNKPISIINIGPTRGDHLAEIKVSARCGELIPKLRFS